MATINCDSCGMPYPMEGSVALSGQLKRRFLCPRCKQELLQRAPNRRLTYPCAQCSGEFPTYHKRRLHQLKVHEMIEQPFYCDVCDKPFGKKSQMQIHKRVFHPRPKRGRSEATSSQEKSVSHDMSKMKI